MNSSDDKDTNMTVLALRVSLPRLHELRYLPLLALLCAGPVWSQEADQPNEVDKPIAASTTDQTTTEETQAQSGNVEQANAPVEQPLSVAPSKTLLPEDRPSWITTEPDYYSETHRFVVASIPTATRDQLNANLDAPLVESLRDYVIRQMRDDRAGELLAEKLSPEFIRSNLMDDKLSYVAELSTTGGSMFQQWVMVEVTPALQEQLQTWYRERIQRERMAPLALALLGVITLIGAGNLVFKRSARKTIDQSIQLPVVQVSKKKRCCDWNCSWGVVVATIVAIVAATRWFST